MYTISRIHSLIKPAMRGTFQRHVDACEADKYSKKFSCHELLVTMLFATFSNSKSLRILEQRFNAHPTGHYHLRTHAIHRSTLSYALAQKDITPFIAFAQGLMQSADRKLRRESKTLLYLLDSTTIDLGADLTTGRAPTTTAVASSCISRWRMADSVRWKPA